MFMVLCRGLLRAQSFRSIRIARREKIGKKSS
jgi:hypothetical protein